MKKLEQTAANFVKAQQYIHNSYLIVKELIENSLDANSTSIKAVIDDTSIIVEDNGLGIENLSDACKFGYTSKENNSYKVLGIEYATNSFEHGFRGQALASIREQCDIEIISRSRSSDLGLSLNYNIGILQKCTREFGTTVKVSNLFKNCPIRQKLDQKNIKSSISKIINLIKSFCYVYDVHFTLVFKGKILICEQGSSDTKKYALAAHRAPVFEIIEPYFSFFLFPHDKSNTKIMLYEKRICKCDIISKIIDKTFNMFFTYKPTFVIIFNEGGDINLSIDKTEVILKNNKYIENRIKSELDKYFASMQFVGAKAKINYEDLDLAITNNSNKSICHNGFENQDCNFFKKINCCEQEKECDNISKAIGSSEIANDINSSFIKNKPLLTAYYYIKEDQLHHENLIIKKSDFKLMEIIGQFNKGFILCKLTKENQDFLVAVDQHAANEIYNFELLKKTFSLKKQLLIKPLDLKLTAIQELLIEENMTILEKNGFEVCGNKLISIPVYQNNFFTTEDFFSLLDNISIGNETSDKFRKIMASKACRSSIMIGDSLSYKDMRQVVDQLSELELPWNCPHGRPTYKVLSEF